MNESFRGELEEIKQQQVFILQQITEVQRKVSTLQERLDRTVSEPAPQAATPPPLPPQGMAQVPVQEIPIVAQASVPPVEPIVPKEPVIAELPVFSAVSQATESEVAQPIPVEIKPARSFEMHLGTYWLVRIGVVMLLTGLAWLGFVAFGQMGAMGRLALLYLGSFGLLGVGAWLQRKQESGGMRQYGQVLLAGGLAAVYFTTYAAHHLEALRVIPNEWVEGLLLLLWTGVMVWVADRKKSEVLALFGVGLAYYTSIITSVGIFTLYSNLLLTVAAVFFLLRNRWATVSGASLVATYAGFVFWRFYHPQWFGSLRTGRTELMLGNLFLLGCWVTFTVAVFRAQLGRPLALQRAIFATLNNGALIGLVGASMMQHRQGNFWKVALVLGSVWMGLAVLARKVLNEKPLEIAYFTQGLILVTSGVIAYFSGLHLALVLALESAVLLAAGWGRDHRIMRGGAIVVAMLSLLTLLIRSEALARNWWLGAGVSLLFGFNAVWSGRRSPEEKGRLLRMEPAYYAGILVVGSGFTALHWAQAHGQQAGPILAALTVLCTLSLYVARVREITLVGQTLLMVALGGEALRFLLFEQPGEPWATLTTLGVSLVLGHWWQHQKQILGGEKISGFLQGLFAGGFVFLLFLWLRPHLDQLEIWLLVASGLAVMLTVYGFLTRNRFLSVFGQIFLVAGILEFVRLHLRQTISWDYALGPIVGLLAIAWLGARFGRAREASMTGENRWITLARIYQHAALLLGVGWIHVHIPYLEREWVLALLATGFLAWRAWKKHPGAAVSGALFLVLACGRLVYLAAANREALLYGPNLVGLVLFVGVQQFWKRRGETDELGKGLEGALLWGAGLGIWLMASVWVVHSTQGAGALLTAAWAILALGLFGAGLWLRERFLRWMGLILLGLALGRVVLVDVWRWPVIYRAVSFLVLGAVIVGLGFLYNRYQERIKKWL